MSLLIAGRLIQRFGPAPVVAAGLLCFAAGGAWWALAASLEPSYATVIGGMALIGVGIGLALPTLMGTATGALPASSFATGSGVVNMIRQTGMAVGVAPSSPSSARRGRNVERLVAFRHAWWAMAAIVALGLIPALLLRRPSARAANASPLAANPQPS